MARSSPPESLGHLEYLEDLQATLQATTSKIRGKKLRDQRLTDCNVFAQILSFIRSLLRRCSTAHLSFFDYTDPDYPTTTCIGLRISIDESEPISFQGFAAFTNGRLLHKYNHIRAVLDASIGTGSSQPLLSGSIDTGLRIPETPNDVRLQTLVVYHLSKKECFAGKASAWPSVLSVAQFVALMPAGERETLHSLREGRARPDLPASSAASSMTSESTEASSFDDGFGSTDSDEEEEAKDTQPPPKVDGISLVDVAVRSGSHRSIVEVEFDDDASRIAELATGQPRDAWSGKTDRPPLRPVVTSFVVILRQWYTDPVRLQSDAFRQLLVKFSVSYQGFLRMRAAHFLEKNGGSLRHAPYVTQSRQGKPTRPRVSYTFWRRDFRTSVEGQQVKLQAEGELTADDPSEKFLYIFLVCDGAGRLINFQKGTHFALITSRARSFGALSSVLIVAMHFGPFADVHRRTIMNGAVGEQIQLLSKSTILGKKVVLINYSDWGDAPKFYRPPSLYGPIFLNFFTQPNLGWCFFERKGCGRCSNSMAEIFALPSIPPVMRLQPPDVRGNCDPITFLYGKLHELAHGPPCFAGDVVLLLISRCERQDPGGAGGAGGAGGRGSDRKKLFAVATRISGIFPKPGFNPKRDPVSAAAAVAEPDADGRKPEAEEAAEAGGRLFAEDATGKAPPHAARPRDVKDFLDRSELNTSIAADLGELHIILSHPSTPETMPLEKLWLDVMEFFNVVRHPSAHLRNKADAELWGNRGRRLWFWYKVMAALAVPVDFDGWLANPPEWLNKRKTPAADIIAEASHVQMDVPALCMGISAHLAFEHAFDIFDVVPFPVACRVTEEAFDHYFVYLYYTVPVVAPRCLTGFRNAEATWRTVLETQTARTPVQTREKSERMMKNRAYS